MSVLEGGRGARKDLGAHGLAEADLLPHHSSSPQILPCSLVPADKRSEVTWTGEREVEYLDIFSRDDEEADEGSEWSEEDLSLHFSPSVILQSDDEESEPESGLDCACVTMETQVMKKDNPPERGGVTERHSRPFSFLRQNSMPASLHTHPTASGEAASYRVYKGRIAGANSGLPLEGSRRCLQKSYSLDESKTKMASSLLMNILSKKMQVEQSSTTNSLKKLEAAPAPPAPPAPPAGQQGEQQGKTGASKAPLHLVRDVKSFNSLNNSKAVSMNSMSCNAIGQEESVSRHPAAEGKHHTAMVTASLSKSQNRQQDDADSRPAANEKQNSHPMDKSEDTPPVQPVHHVQSIRHIQPVCHVQPVHHVQPVRHVPSELNQSETAAVSFAPLQRSPPDLQKQKSSESAPELHFRPCSTQSQRSTRCEASPLAPIQLLHPCFYRLQPNLRSIPFIHPPLTCMPSHLHPPAPPHLLVNPDKSPIKVRDNSSNRTETSGDPDRRSFGRCEQVQPPQQPLPESSQTFTLGQVCKDLVSTAAPGVLFSAPASCHLVLDASSQRGFYMDAGPAAQRKLLLDPETGRFVQVFLPAGSAPPMLGGNPTVLPVIQFPVMGVPLLYSGPYLPVTMTTPHDDVAMILHHT
ncbi:PREDICTED: uncharacterized protein LOC106918542 isoform X1 [Poecilia mexicana]|uniref:uncharacterized protein LOC106918542 isoform X1 n=1 Tax=Poecilia mexicana TaxID=48701 RepID=UPI00072DFEF3|nr:PREDICTED: uncharacterized protein LOC106918542 isoform X1 [Poecilia mexicana]